MRFALLFSLLSGLLACAGGELHPTTARVRVPEALAFPETFVGDTARLPLLVEAGGSGAVELESLGADDATIAFENAGTRTIAGGTSTTVTLLWQPLAEGPLDTRLVVHTDVGDAPVKLTGTARALPDCDDRNDCTDDAFDHETRRCVHRAREGTCDDGSACTEGDRCADGVCRGVARTCDDHSDCTLDLCDPLQGCVFRANPARCDDADPCTQDVCDPSGGCSHPPAEDGTSCGAFSCALARVCVRGECRALDVSATSDGLPCDDGNACSAGDRCVAGRCEPVDAESNPLSVEAVIETWGGAGTWIATDGYRFVVAGPHANTRILTQGAQGLEVRSTLDVTSDVPPVFVSPGTFAVAMYDELVVIDARDPLAPQVARRITLRPPAYEARQVTQLARAGTTLVAALLRNYSRTDILAVTGADTATPAIVPVDRVPEQLLDLDADDFEIAWLGDHGGRWLLVDGGWNVTRSEPITGTIAEPRRVSVKGDQLAVLAGDRLELRTMSSDPSEALVCGLGASDCAFVIPANCDASAPFRVPAMYRLCGQGHGACPSGYRCASIGGGTESPQDDACAQRISLCLSPETPLATRGYVSASPVDDLVLDDGNLFWTGPTGIHALSLADVTGSATSAPVLVDPLHATFLDRGPGHLLAAGPIALALRTDVPASRYTRLSGFGHGDVRVAADVDAQAVALAGPVAAGVLDLQTKKLSSWSILPTASTPVHPRLLRGTSRAAAVDAAVTSDPTRTDPACFGVSVETTGGTGRQDFLPLCGIQNARLMLAGTRLYSFGDPGPLRVPPAVGSALRTWDLRHPGPAPEHERYVNGTALLRPEDGSERIVALRALPDASIFTIEGWDAGHVETPPVLSTSIALGGHLDRQEGWFGTDGDAFLAAEFERIELFDLGNAGALRASIPYAPGRSGPSLLAMSGGRAWIVDPESPLQQLSYDVAAGRLVSSGAVDLGPVDGVFDAGTRAVAFGPAKVSVLRPACR